MLSNLKPSNRTRAWALAAAVTLSILSVDGFAATCRYRYYPVNEPFTSDQVTTPNSVCIFPDGRSILGDGTEGFIEIVVYWLQHLDDTGQWLGATYQPSLLLYGGTALCGGGISIDVDLSGGLPAVFYQQPIYGGGHSPIGADGLPYAGCVFDWAPSNCGDVELHVYFNSPDINVTSSSI